MTKRLFIFLFLFVFLIGQVPVQGQVDVEVFISVINVWVKATDSNGLPVADLTAEDFEIYEDGQKMTLDCFEAKTIDVTKEPAAEVDPPRFVIFLDLLNTKSGELLFLKPKLMEFLDQLAPLSYEVMVFALLPNGKLGVVRSFTRNTVQVKTTIEQAKGNASLEGEVRDQEQQIRSLLERLEQEPEPIMSIEDLAETNRTLNPLYERNTQALRSSYHLADQFTKQQRSRAELSIYALESVGKYLAHKSQGGHTVVVYISGGFNTEPGRYYYDYIEKVAERKGFIFDRQVYAMRVGKSEPEQFNLQGLLTSAIGKLNRLNVTLYSVGTGGMGQLADASRGSHHPDSSTYDITRLETALQDSLKLVAQETGGLAFTNSQNFQVGFDRIVADLSHNYLLCYAPPEHKTPQYHNIKVVAKRPGISLRYRKGYWD